LTQEQGYRVHIRGPHIAVTFSGTSFCVDYPKPKKGQAFSPTGFSKPADATAAQVAGFLLVARTLAYEKAKELGWILNVR
jgi:hypothetical protein